jgi:hypothetical protein
MIRHQTQELVMTQQVDKQLVDAASDAYVEWREESAEVWDAYARWAHAPNIDAAGAFMAYRAALDREESASHAYADLLGFAFGKGQTDPRAIRTEDFGIEEAEASCAADPREPTCRTGEDSIQEGAP